MFIKAIRELNSLSQDVRFGQIHDVVSKLRLNGVKDIMEEDLTFYLTYNCESSMGEAFLWEFIKNAVFLDKDYSSNEMQDWVHNEIHDVSRGEWYYDKGFLFSSCHCEREIKTECKPIDLETFREDHKGVAILCRKTRYCMP